MIELFLQKIFQSSNFLSLIIKTYLHIKKLKIMLYKIHVELNFAINITLDNNLFAFVNASSDSQ